MKKQVKKTQNEDKKKKRKIVLLATLIPLGVAAAATAITLPLVLKKKGDDQGPKADFTLTAGEYWYELDNITFEQGKTYIVKILFGSTKQPAASLSLYDNDTSSQFKGFNTAAGKTKVVIDGSEISEFIVGEDSIIVDSASKKTSGWMTIQFEWIGETATGDLYFGG